MMSMSLVDGERPTYGVFEQREEMLEEPEPWREPHGPHRPGGLWQGDRG